MPGHKFLFWKGEEKLDIKILVAQKKGGSQKILYRQGEIEQFLKEKILKK